MRRKYQTPETIVTEVYQEHFLMASDATTQRKDDGSPTKDDTFPTDIGTTSETPDPFGGNGQNGNTTRSKESFDIWDDTGW